MGLTKYRQKRDFSKTPEPSGKADSSKKRARALSFVVQQHHASHQHFDFRLEYDGVLKSWAVPKGPSLDPAEKRLAVQVEDHPLEYGGFEGTIPEGEYGAGSVIVWDRGTWVSHEGHEPSEGLRKGSLKFTLKGKKLRGGFALVRMRTADGEKKNWLLIKEKDEHARPHDEFDVIAEEPKSVKSGRTIDQIGAGDRQWKSNRKAATKRSKTRKKSSKRASSMPSAPAAAPPRPPTLGQVPGARRGGIPARLEPQLATLVEEVPAGDGWTHEVKFDGYRILAVLRDGGVSLMTRNGNDWTDRFPSVAAALHESRWTHGVLDGEVVVLDEQGISRFQLLQAALKRRAAATGMVYFVFDAPYWQGHDLTGARLEDRQSHLRSLFASEPDLPPTIRLSTHIDGHGVSVLREACRLHLEGIVSKRLDSRYTAGRTTSWVKVKCSQRQEFVVGGFTEPRGGRSGFGSLLLGHFDAAGDLVYAGKVGAGFDEEDLRSLARRLKGLERAAAPFASPPRVLGGRAHWVSPVMVAEVSFTEWTSDGRLRHPVFLGMREDKEAAEVKRERAKAPTPRTRRTKGLRNEDGKGTESVLSGVTITHPERVVYPSEGLTKLDVARYYGGVANEMLAQIKDRPISLLRCPGGSDGGCFFHKHVETREVEGLRLVKIKETGGPENYAAITGVGGLMHLVQMNALEFHVWGSRADDVDRPDRMIFDLDPGPDVEWDQVADGAEALRDAFASMDMETFIMTSGGKGIHVVVPMRRTLAWDRAKAFAHSVATAMMQADPKRFIDTMSKAKRHGKVFVDYLRVQRGATSVAPYSARARAGAGVAMPIEWDDLRAVRPDQYTVLNAGAHLRERRRDPWEGVERARQSIPARVLTAAGV